MADISVYLSRITSYHSNKPKFMAMVGTTLQPFVDAQNLLANLSSYFDLDTAVGVQLDIVGQWINLSRNVTVPVPDPWFRWGDITRGWGRGFWKQPFDPGSFITQLDDETYRRLLRARILANHWDGTAADALSVLNTYFVDPASNIIVDDKTTMQVIFGISGKIPGAINLELFAGDYLPLSASGVRTYHLVTSINNKPLFGWGVNNSIISGWGSGAWGVTPEYLINNPAQVLVVPGDNPSFRIPSLRPQERAILEAWVPPPPQPQVAWNLNPAIENVPVNNPPFAYGGRRINLASEIAILAQPDPWQYIFTAAQPYGRKPLPPSIIAVPINNPPFNIPSPSTRGAILGAWVPPPPSPPRHS